MSKRRREHSRRRVLGTRASALCPDHGVQPVVDLFKGKHGSTLRLACGCRRAENLRDIGAGQKFGRLKTVSASGDKWLCTCSCGATVEVSASDLRQRVVKSCGCLQQWIAKKVAARLAAQSVDESKAAAA